jgi:alcohol dehydrogenase class IV
MPDMTWLNPKSTSTFRTPGKLVMGRGAVREVPALLRDELRVADGATVFLLTDRIVGELAEFGELRSAVAAAGYDVVFGAVSGPEPDSVEVDRLVAIARSASAGVVVGVGGGSVLDAAKLIAFLTRNTGSSADAVGPTTWPVARPPLVLIPTTCGTGSEVTPYAMVTVDGHKRASASPEYVPDAAVLDPSLLDSLPPAVLAATGMDALSHATESLLSTLRSPMSDLCATAAIGMVTRWIEPAVNGDLDARATMLWASHLAGMSLNAGVIIGHSLAYCFAHESPTPMAHGVSCALALPLCLAYNRSVDPERASLVAGTITNRPDAGLLDAAEVIRGLTERLGLPTTLVDAGIPDERYEEIAATCVNDYPRPGNPIPMERDRVLQVLRTMGHGELAAAFTDPAG